ncbi:hypothetical protein C1Y08_01055 [Pseudomonas sp. FW306-02-F02-AA]|uniref:Uncharacterized protein n=1 Tax=Pseudomonas fluorescens TaxID=294 RepID=A0A0N9VYU0_PSEFL|nr:MULTISPECIES: hypothetical protein [Pseudomonas]ALI04080.1 hypothetical protein AO353_24555 [Pseudomonas fluorescens]PMZ02163.1 hypothetical protein C1Y07_21500 [Pseudomonas sp. FW306-02-F02-AB]PMZ07854.1 hypothetical protein C1Y06_22485 [Pseudomonas sp. FW306-02-H06C]PMZ17928.1 hypothetical protein C1Y08_01055 [Pseudomonas sp. FW306-02-F02-AA]PMZ23961.1 hypothetical protein C1Y09_01060 [Pseudomonas sp. FW306-02-F08-AA]
MKEMQIVDGRLDEKSRGFGGDVVSYHYWKIDGKKHERLEIPDVLDAHVKAGNRIRATYQPGKDNVNRIWAIQLDDEPVRSVVDIPFIAVSLGRLSILPLAVAIFTIFVAYGFWENSANHRSFHGSSYQLSWIALNLFVSYRYMIKPMLMIKRGINAFREYCAKAPASTSTAS